MSLQRLELLAEGKTTEELLEALDEAKRLIALGNVATGHWMSNGNDGGFSFAIAEGSSSGGQESDA